MMIVFLNYDYDDVDRYYLCLHTDSDSDIGNDDGYDEDERSDNDGGDKNDFVDNYDEDGFYYDFKDEDNFEDNDDENGCQLFAKVSTKGLDLCLTSINLFTALLTLELFL